MLTISDIPDYLELIYTDHLETCSAFYQQLPAKEMQKIPSGYNFGDFSADTGIFYLSDGYIKLYKDDKIIRLYNQGEFLVLGSCAEFKQVNDFAVKGCFWSFDEFYQILQSGGLAAAWLNIRERDNRINLNLAGVYLGEDVKLDFKHQNFMEGETIIRRGDEPEMIYELVSGEAVVLADNKEVGRIYEDEIFGEISFLTESTRSADVLAASACTVRMLDMATFERLISLKPQMILSIAKTLAGRIVHLNDKLVRV